MSKKKPKKSSAKPAEIAVGGIIPTDRVKFAKKSSRGSSYDALFAEITKAADRVKSSGKSQTVLVPVPHGIEPRTFQNRLNSALRKTATLPAGFVISKRVTEDQKSIGISVIKKASPKK